jgi:hypothetical protein
MASVPSPHRQRTSVFPTPLIGDVLFSERVVCQTKAVPAYGTAHPNTARWPNHKLVFAKERPEPESVDTFDFYYAADRASQDLYNFEQIGGEQVIRTYVIPRELYRGRKAGTAGLVAGEFTYPDAGAASPDIRFTQFCFVDDTQRRYEKEFDSMYVIIQRRFIRPKTIDYVYDEQFRRNIRITKEIIPLVTISDAPPTIGLGGSSVEIQDGNLYHSVKITKEVVLIGAESYPYELPVLPGNQDFKFPSKLDSVGFVWSYALAAADGFAPAYAEDSFFKPKIIDPRPGPYSATIRRFITRTPEEIKTLYPLTPIPQPVREAVSSISWYSYASEEYGNRARATAKEWAVPSTIHGVIVVGVDPQDPTPPPAAAQRFLPTIAATPGSAAFFALTEATIGYQVREMPYGLFEVTVVKINIANLYG